MISDFQRYKLTYTLIGLNLVVYILSVILSQNIIDIDMETLVNMGALFGPYTIIEGEWWRLGTAIFLHGGMTHLLMNMFSLYLIGRGVEQYFNTESYLSIYFFSGILGALASLYVHPQSVGMGASGAIFGIFGALAGFFIAHREKIQDYTKSFMKDFAIIIALNLVIGLSIPSVDMSAHIGGLVIGAVGGFVISKNPRWIWAYVVTMVLLIMAIISYLPQHYVQILF
ncbi:MAG: rhomboid family intramembrane serine protease [Sulfurovum sp.]|nr:MAG: rhomboid family intramembrane serine protease [Sulfurovum sp.]